MLATISRTTIAAVLGAGLTLGTASAVAAAPTTAAEPTFSISATGFTYGQPDLNGTRTGTNTVTITNNTGSTIESPMVTFPNNGRDSIDHSGLSGCPLLVGGQDQTICYTRPLRAGEARTLTLGWVTDERGPAGRSAVRVAVGADTDGTAVPGTTSRTSYRVSFAPLTGTFDIRATDLTYGPHDSNGVRHGSTRVTITNLTDETIPYPLVSFAEYAGDGTVESWKSCLTITDREGRAVCAVKPLGPGERRTTTFRFHLNGSSTQYDSQVQVEAGTGIDGAVVPGTAAGTSYTVRSPGDDD
jgi:hypothetical protein